MLEPCLKKLESHAVRRTENRAAILNVLHAAQGPLAPPDIVQRCHASGRLANKTTVYRELERMERAGVVHKVMVSDRKQYFELTERGHHHHFVCRECDQVFDIALNDLTLLRQVTRIGEQLGFMIQTHAIEFYGRCKKCTI